MEKTGLAFSKKFASTKSGICRAACRVFIDGNVDLGCLNTGGCVGHRIVATADLVLSNSWPCNPSSLSRG